MSIVFSAAEGFELQEVNDIPANNLGIVFGKR
jgi:hypothetical protein